MQTLNKPTFLDLFSGCGGLSLGLFNAGWQGILAVEKHPDAFSTLKHNLITSKVSTHHFKWPEWLKQEAMEVSCLLANHERELVALKGQIDLIAGGPPCQGFSTAGKRDPNDPRNSLTEEYLEVINLVQPRFLLIENVRGFNSAFKANGKKEPYSHIVKKKLERLGYTVFSRTICCSDFGVPQHRKRFIMLAIRDNDPVLGVLGERHLIDVILNHAQAFRMGKGLNAAISTSTQEALSDLETSRHKLVQHVGRFKCFKQIGYNEPKKLSDYQKLMRLGMNGRAPSSMRLARHSDIVVSRFRDIQVFASRGRSLTPADRKVLGIKKHSTTPLHPLLPSATVTTLPDDILHYSEPRILTVRENARLQSFPDWFEFRGKYTTGGKNRKTDCPRYTQVGNAVPPLLAEAIGSTLLGLLHASNTDTVRMIFRRTFEQIQPEYSYR